MVEVTFSGRNYAGLMAETLGELTGALDQAARDGFRLAWMERDQSSGFYRAVLERWGELDPRALDELISDELKNLESRKEEP